MHDVILKCFGPCLVLMEILVVPWVVGMPRQGRQADERRQGRDLGGPTYRKRVVFSIFPKRYQSVRNGWKCMYDVILKCFQPRFEGPRTQAPARTRKRLLGRQTSITGGGFIGTRSF